jgi:hypothetical protein
LLSTPRSTPPASDRTPGVESPSIELPGNPGSGSSSPRSTTQRPIDEGGPTAPADTPPKIELPPLLDVPAPSKPAEPLPVPPGGRDILHPVTPEMATPKLLDKKVTHLFLNPALTGATDFDGQPGDDGLRVVLEPRNATEAVVPEAGSVSIVVLDPDRQGDAARVARWDFDQSAMRQLIVDSSSGRGIKLEMPWPAAAPAVNRLKLFVRYETLDGRRLQADREIYVSPPGQAISRWTPRSSERVSSAAIAPVSSVSTDAAKSVRSTSAAEIPATPIWSPTR